MDRDPRLWSENIAKFGTRAHSAVHFSDEKWYINSPNEAKMAIHPPLEQYNNNNKMPCYHREYRAMRL